MNEAYNAAQIAKGIRNIERIGAAIISGTQAAGDDVGQDAVRIVKAAIALPVPPRSLPGEPPRRETGRLYASYDYQVIKTHTGAIVEIGSPTEYAIYLEYGTRFMAPRPHLRPSIDVVVSVIPVFVAARVEAAVAGERARMAA